MLWRQKPCFDCSVTSAGILSSKLYGGASIRIASNNTTSARPKVLFPSGVCSSCGMLLTIIDW